MILNFDHIRLFAISSTDQQEAATTNGRRLCSKSIARHQPSHTPTQGELHLLHRPVMSAKLTQIRYLHLGCYAPCLCCMCSLCGIPHRPTSPSAALVCHLATHCPKLWWWDLAWHALCEVPCNLWLEWNRLVIRSGMYASSHVKNSLLMSAGVTLTVCGSGLGWPF